MREGARLPFLGALPRPFHIRRGRLEPALEQAAATECLKLIEQGVLEVTTSRPRCVSPLFMVPKPGNKWRLIVDMRVLNLSINAQPFVPETLRSIDVRPGDHLCSVDLKDGFYAIPVARVHQTYLGTEALFPEPTSVTTPSGSVVRVHGWTWMQFAALPMGMSASPFFFQRAIRAVVAALRLQGVRIFPYVDDLLIAGYTASEARQSLSLVLQRLVGLGLHINLSKSDLRPRTGAAGDPVRHLGFLWLTETTSGEVILQLPGDKRCSILRQVRRTLQQASGPLHRFLVHQITGLIIATTNAIVPARALLQSTFACLREHDPQSAFITLSADARRDLSALMMVLAHSTGKALLQPPPTVTVTTDASKLGYGAFLGSGLRADQQLSGEWGVCGQRLSSNRRELLAVLIAVTHFRDSLVKQTIRIRTDNLVTAAYINGQGGRCPELNVVAQLLLKLTWSMQSTIFAEYLPGELNTVADALSRNKPVVQLPNYLEWRTNPVTFHLLDRLHGPFTIDRFATATNALLPRFAARLPGHGAVSGDGLTAPWTNENSYIAAPFRLIPAILHRLQRESRNELATIIAPIWPNRPWFRTLLDMTRAMPTMLEDSSMHVHHDFDDRPAEPLKNASWRLAVFPVWGGAPDPARGRLWLQRLYPSRASAAAHSASLPSARGASSRSGTTPSLTTTHPTTCGSDSSNVCVRTAPDQSRPSASSAQASASSTPWRTKRTRSADPD